MQRLMQKSIYINFSQFEIFAIKAAEIKSLLLYLMITLQTLKLVYNSFCLQTCGGNAGYGSGDECN